MAKKLIITIIALTVGALHFIKGENYQGPFSIFVNGYLIDILLPMTLYLLLSLFQNKLIRSPIFRGCAVFGFGCVVEASQYFGYPIFGSTFDLLDILAYAGGVLLGILLDLVFFLMDLANNYTTTLPAICNLLIFITLFLGKHCSFA